MSLPHPGHPTTSPASLVAGRRWNAGCNATLAALVFFASLGVTYVPAWLDLPVARAIGQLANRSLAFDRLMFDFDMYFSFSGVALMALVWCCWFGGADAMLRARMLCGVAMTVVAGAVSRFLQHTLPSHPRPLYDPALGFHAPSVLGPASLNTWNSFPSDHVAVFGCLLAVIFLARKRLGWLAAAWLVPVESARLYMGAHYLSDLVGGGALAFGLVWAVQGVWTVGWARHALAWERAAPGWFYAVAFFLAYQVATLFVDARNIMGGFSGLGVMGP